MLQPTNDLLNSSTAEFKVPSSTNDSTAVTVTVPTSGATSVDVHVAAINSLLAKLKEATVEVEEIVGQHIAAIKTAAPNNWETIVKARCGLSRSRAYQLMAIAEGVTSADQVRAADAAKHRRLRAARRIRDVPDSERELAAARAQLDELEEGHARQIARFEKELAQLGDARNLGSERDQLRKALGEIVELLAETRGLMTQAVRNRTAITTKITRAEKIATSALKPAKVTIVNLPAKQAA
jgi:hypothetical protein